MKQVLMIALFYIGIAALASPDQYCTSAGCSCYDPMAAMTQPVPGTTPLFSPFQAVTPTPEVAPTPAPTRTAKPAICSAQPFTADTQYMSVQGYLRWQHFQEASLWWSHHQTMAMTKEELKICAMP